MLIGEIANLSGVTKDTIRLYTRIGLLSPTMVPAGSREYADYSEDDVQLVRDIKTSQAVGFTLAQIKVLADDYSAGTMDETRQRDVLEKKVSELSGSRRDLDKQIAIVRAKLAQLDSGAEADAGKPTGRNDDGRSRS